jgi:hypothetical protein
VIVQRPCFLLAVGLWKTFRSKPNAISVAVKDCSACHRNRCSASDRNAVRLHNGMAFSFRPESRSPSTGFRLRQLHMPSFDGEQLTDAACKMVWEIMQPMRRAIEEQGFDGFDAFVARHRTPAPEVGPHPAQPNLTEKDAEKWWSSKTPRERYAALRGGSPDGPKLGEVVLVGFGIIGETCRAVSLAAEWNDIDDNSRSILLSDMRKGRVAMPETIRRS